MADIKFSQFNVGNDCQVGDIIVGLRASDNYQFTFPGTGLKDSSGNFFLEYDSPGSGAINHIFIENAITSTSPTIAARGTDTDISLQLSSKGTGSVMINDINVDMNANISSVASVMFSGSSSGQAILEAQAAAGTPTLRLPNTSGTLALTSALPSFPITLAQGGTGASLSASNGGIFYSNASTGAILAGTATAHQALLSGSSTAPTWSTATYPATTTISQLLYSSSSNVISGLATANSAVLTTSPTGVPTWSNSMTSGQVVIGSSIGIPQAATLTAGAGVSITNGANSITVSATGAGLTWSVIAGTSQAAAVGNGYIPSNGALTTITLPASCNPGDMISVQGQGSGQWIIQANTGQVIHVGSSASSTAGTVASSDRYDAITLLCIVANTDWAMCGPVSSGFVIV